MVSSGRLSGSANIAPTQPCECQAKFRPGPAGVFPSRQKYNVKLYVFYLHNILLQFDSRTNNVPNRRIAFLIHFMPMNQRKAGM